ncbi:3-oxo-5-alpha-steroid 4-dehydrogenase [Dictyocaulus viviparus]|uniref:Polyprenal reductase n=1 Tax=Dictyocaulus viviparus TaxID=29172 RepID=A0A0D8XBU3_DICVI|nr:3-oxo-5-alpha-steroid 4-dehydrogenase [Dictyocaulus viviparus]
MLPPLLPFYLVAVTLGLSLACTLTLFVPSCPPIVPALTTYGVSALYLRDRIKFIQVISVPKRWFWHFYLLGSFCVISWLLFCGAISYGMASPSDALKDLFGLLTPAKPRYNWSTTVLGLFLILLHVMRRLWEAVSTLQLCISVYSDTTMNIFHYIVGLIHYTILPLTIVCESRGLVETKNGVFLFKKNKCCCFNNVVDYLNSFTCVLVFSLTRHDIKIQVFGNITAVSQVIDITKRELSRLKATHPSSNRPLCLGHHVFTTKTISPWQWFGIALFLICNREQHHISREIAALRRAPDGSGLIFNYCHGICYGGWFEYVSCPHFLFEMGIYISLWMVLSNAYVFQFLVIFVVVNQLFAGQITHRWYRRTFKAYPIDRKAVVPFIL